MAAGDTPSPARDAQRKPRDVLKLRFAFRLGSTSPRGHGHAEGGERRAVGGQREEAATALPRHGSPRPTRQGGGDGGRVRQGGRVGNGELSPRRGGARGADGDLSAWSAYPGGGAVASETGSVAVHTCHACFKTFDRIKALYGHMRSCRGVAAEELAPALPRRERKKKLRAEKKEGEADLLTKDLARTWAMTGQRGRGGRSPSHGTANESQHAKSARVAAPAPDRARVAEILREVTGLQIGEEDLDRPWVSEMARGAQDFTFLTSGEAVSVLVADGDSEQGVATVPVPLAKISEVKVPEPTYTVRNSPVVPETEVIVIDDDERNGIVPEINYTSSVIVATDEAATVAIAPAPDAAAAVTVASGSASTAAAATIAAATPDAAYVNGNGGAAATRGAGAGEMRMFPCPKCYKVFDCFRGLGGHMAFHKSSKRRAKELQDIRDVSASLAVTLSGGRTRDSAWANGRRFHVCAKCGKTFATGQSLGGHMRLHYAGPPLMGNAGRAVAWAAANTAFVHGPAASGIGFPFPAATTSGFPFAFAVPKQEEEGKPPGVMAMARGNGARGHLRLFGIDIAEGPEQEPRTS